MKIAVVKRGSVVPSGAICPWIVEVPPEADKKKQ
jgi:hypothetical protein